MSVTIQQVNSEGIRVFMGTITNQASVHDALAETAVTLHIQAATVHLLGGLHQAELTAYDFHTQTRHEPILLKRPLEIIGGHGTICILEGEPHVHLHLTLSYRDTAVPSGIVVVGGHIAQAIAFAVEFTLTAYDGYPVHRALHTQTGLALWHLPPLDNYSK